MIRPVTSNTEVAALLDKQAAAIRWMAFKRIPLITGQSHVEAWLDLVQEAGQYRADDVQEREDDQG